MSCLTHVRIWLQYLKFNRLRVNSQCMSPQVFCLRRTLWYMHGYLTCNDAWMYMRDHTNIKQDPHGLRHLFHYSCYCTILFLSSYHYHHIWYDVHKLEAVVITFSLITNKEFLIKNPNKNEMSGWYQPPYRSNILWVWHVSYSQAGWNYLCVFCQDFLLEIGV